MEKNQEGVNINLTPNANGEYPQIPAIRIIHVEESAPEPLPLKEELTVKLKGILTAPADWIEKRSKKDGFNALDVHVVANYTERTILLVMEEKNVFGTQITGKLELHPELKNLGINENKIYDEKTLFNKLQFMERFFVNNEAYQTLMLNLKKFKAKINQEFANINDLKGTAALQKAYEIKTDIPLEFMLNMPIFCNGFNQTFKVDINIALDSGAVVFWLVSVNLHTSVEKQTEDMFETELKRLEAYTIVKQY